MPEEYIGIYKGIYNYISILECAALQVLLVAGTTFCHLQEKNFISIQKYQLIEYNMGLFPKTGDAELKNMSICHQLVKSHAITIFGSRKKRKHRELHENQKHHHSFMWFNHIDIMMNKKHDTMIIQKHIRWLDVVNHDVISNAMISITAGASDIWC